MANHNKRKQRKEPMGAGAKRAKTRVTKSRLVLVLHLIGWVGGASFLDQSQSVVMKNKSNSATQLKTALYKVLFDLQLAT